METIDVIKQRHAVRESTDALIERSRIQHLTDAAILALSAMNLQPQAFAVLLNRERIGDYARQIKDWLLANFQQTSLDPSLRKLIEGDSYSVFHSAPALMLVLAKPPVPASYEVVVPIVLGHPKAWPESHRRSPAEIH